MKSGHLFSIGLVTTLLLLRSKSQKANVGYIGATNIKTTYESLYDMLASSKSFEPEIIKIALYFHSNNIKPLSKKWLSVSKDAVIKYFSKYNDTIDLKSIPPIFIEKITQLLAKNLVWVIEEDMAYVKRYGK